MLAVEQIAEWRGQEVVDSEGEKVGKLEDVYYRRDSDEAVFARVKRGVLGRHSTLVPLARATVGRDYVRIDASPDQVERAEKIEVQDGILAREAAAQLGSIYDLRIDGDEDFESSSLIAERIERAQAARERAQELQEEARKRTEESDSARAEAQQAGQQADAAEADAQRARQAAAEARREAEALEPALQRTASPDEQIGVDQAVGAADGSQAGAPVGSEDEAGGSIEVPAGPGLEGPGLEGPGLEGPAGPDR